LAICTRPQLAKLEQNRGRIGGAPRRSRLDTGKAKLSKIERSDKGINCPNRIILRDPVINTRREKCRLATIRTGDEATHMTLQTVTPS